MSWTRRQLINQAFEEIGLASYEFDLQPEQLLSAKRRLDSMMATWNSKGIRCGYPLTSTPDAGDLDDDTGVSDMDVDAIYLNLAVRLASLHGRVVTPELKSLARSTFKDILRIHSETQPAPRNNMRVPAGAGNRRTSTTRVYLDRPAKTIDAGGDAEIDI